MLDAIFMAGAKLCQTMGLPSFQIWVIQWMQNPTELAGLREFEEWKDKCTVQGNPFCSLPNSCPVTTRELPGETLRLFTCMDCPNNYPWILDPTGDNLNL
ncbi:unnamed protein product [Notodromas monacha]|uniref:Uncharacterized protein n=1 Tax=Notodromas monacha TaxID=399045 RepID=A0A7R9GBI2_9CRUS|nr:unnamed protein product [Notodromas monacha]CAG0916546.1 unnamed protein product [Notodromas monacha]